MTIRLYNSWSDQIELLEPLVPGHVSMYVCGPTVYDFVHVGNLRPVVVFDVLRRFLQLMGYQVDYASNYTDIDDRIIAKALASNKSEREIADFFINAYEENVHDINALTPKLKARVTFFLKEIIEYIERLIEKGAAYVVDGEVFFHVPSVSDYGHLSRMKTEELIVGARVESNPKKKSPLDFVLWKKTEQGIAFDSPWGRGRPGWHTECAAIIDKIFPNHMIDIHGGGFDLKFPHHDNEIAQSMAVNGNRLATIWMHNGFVTLNDEKMSKSTGNIMAAKDALATYGGPALRLALLTTHYRLPISLTETVLASAKNELTKCATAYRQAAVAIQRLGVDIDEIFATNLAPFITALSDDLNTSNAVTAMFDIVKEINRELRKEPVDIVELASRFFTLRTMFNILGLDIPFPRMSEDDNRLYERYYEARGNHDFALSDEIRKELMKRGIF